MKPQIPKDVKEKIQATLVAIITAVAITSALSIVNFFLLLNLVLFN
jgi:hypothetical protein